MESLVVESAVLVVAIESPVVESCVAVESRIVISRVAVKTAVAEAVVAVESIIVVAIVVESVVAVEPAGVGVPALGGGGGEAHLRRHQQRHRQEESDARLPHGENERGITMVSIMVIKTIVIKMNMIMIMIK